MSDAASSLPVRAFWLPKAGATEDEYEDAFAFSGESVSGDSGAPRPPARIAVADGATEAAFARRWAGLLVEGFAAHGPAVLASRLAEVQSAWADAVATRAGALPWYAAEKARAGAFAALLGLSFHAARGAETAGTWRATCVGDGDLFHLRDGGLVCAWPHRRADAFGNRPALVGSRPSSEAAPVHRTDGSWQPGDAFVLATDAAAAWLLRTDPARALAWNDNAAFAEAVQRARAEGQLENDDTTVVVVEV